MHFDRVFSVFVHFAHRKLQTLRYSGSVRALALSLLLLALGLAVAQPYGAQVASFRDYREARAFVVHLEAKGFAAYSEFFLHEGLQWVRVRVGCFEHPEGAAHLAGLLRSVTGEAVVMELDREPEHCLRHELGFRLPERWGVAAESDEAVVFWAEVGGVRGFVAFDGTAWRVLQAREVRAAGGGIELELMDGSFKRLESRRGTSRSGLERQLYGAGEPVWHSSGAAVVRLGDRLFAVRVVGP
jgi:hypothetical protein